VVNIAAIFGGVAPLDRNDDLTLVPSLLSPLPSPMVAFDEESEESHPGYTACKYSVPRFGRTDAESFLR
jgi:hypothetical protein